MKTVILLHGLRGSHMGMQAVSNTISAYGYQTMNLDLPGSGERAALQDQTLHGYTEWLHEYIQNLDLPEKPVLIGHSMGSIIVSHHAQKYPDDGDSHLILMSPVFRDRSAMARSKKLYKHMCRTVHLLPENTRYDLLSGKVLSYVVSRYLTVDKSQQDRIDQLHAEYSGHFASVESFLSDAKIAMLEQAVIPQGKRTLMIMGEKDRLITASYVREAAEKAHAQLILLPNSGHLINYEQPVQTAEKIMAFLMEH